MVVETKKNEWDSSYKRGENFIWYPENDMVRFISKYFVKRTGIEVLKYSENYRSSDQLTGLDFGCGIGRGVFLMDEFNINAYGIDISESALELAKSLAVHKGKSSLLDRFYLSDGTSELPFKDDFF